VIRTGGILAFISEEFAKNLASLSRQSAATENSRFEFQKTQLIPIRAHNEMLSVIAIPRLRSRSFDLMISSFYSLFRVRILATGASVTAVGSIAVVVAAVSVRPHNPSDSNRRDGNPMATIRGRIIGWYKNRILTRRLG
jgi:hypothetical protein